MGRKKLYKDEDERLEAERARKRAWYHRCDLISSHGTGKLTAQQQSRGATRENAALL